MKTNYEPQLDESCHPFEEVFPTEDAEAALYVPGSQAPTSNMLKIWNSLARLIFSGQAGFAQFLKTLRSRPSADEGTALPLWPIPAPYPRWLRKNAEERVNYKRMCIEKAINMIVLSLSWMHLGRPAVAPSCMMLGNELSAKQWGVTKRFERLITDLAQAGDFGPTNIGRSAAKVESLAFLLERLQKATQDVVGSYEHQRTAQGVPPRRSNAGHQCGDPGEVVGSLPQGVPQLAKCVEPSRLSFPKDAPGFDPTELFEEPHKSVYKDPVAHAASPDLSKWEPPRVRIHASRDQALELLQFLDRHHRLRLVPVEKVRKNFLCGAFCLVKDEAKDRLILDARPPNLLEETLRDWSKTLGAISAVLQIELLPHHNLIMSGTDLKDYYYCFKVTRARAERNTLNFPLKPGEAQQFQCYSEQLHGHKTLYPCLSTMAMGDCQAVEMGQKCHVKIGLNAGIFSPQELLCIHGLAP